jgi:hypothetical protein
VCEGEAVEGELERMKQGEDKLKLFDIEELGRQRERNAGKQS